VPALWPEFEVAQAHPAPKYRGIAMKQYKMLLLLIGLSVYARAQAQTVTVNWSIQHQTMDGFGGENGGPWSWAVGNTLSDSQADLLFSPTAGIGISIYRTDNTPTNTFPDIQAMQQAVARGAQIELSMAGPPASMKYSGQFGDGTTGASGSCVSASLSSYASYIVGQIQLLQGSPNNIPVSFLDVQNEPNVVGTPGSGNNNGFGACEWSSASLANFVQNDLGPALASAGLSTKVILGSAYPFSNDHFSVCVDDAACSPFVSIVAGHGYGYPGSPVLYNDALSKGKHVWLGETADQSEPFDGTIGSALVMAKNIHSFLASADVSAYNWWELAYGNNGGNCDNCSLVDQTFNTYKRYFAFGNWSKFVRPGWVRVDATANPMTGVYITAFSEQASGKFAIVAINQNSASVNLDFALAAFPAVTSITPTLTSANANLEDQTNVSISNGAFSYSLPGASVITFHGTAGASSASKGPASPTNLAASVK
jgi:glucuronoarabinoxylan endo-1,4-beta-xylanase